MSDLGGSTGPDRFDIKKFLGYDPTQRPPLGAEYREPIYRETLGTFHAIMSRHWPVLTLLAVLSSVISDWGQQAMGSMISATQSGYNERYSVKIESAAQILLASTAVGILDYVIVAFGILYVGIREVGIASEPDADLSGIFRRKLGYIILLSFVLMMVSSLGLILLVIPGLYFIVGTSLALPLLLISNHSVGDSIKSSWVMTAGYRWQIFWMMAVVFITQEVMSWLGTSASEILVIATDVHMVGDGLGLAVSAFNSLISNCFSVVLYLCIRAREKGPEGEMVASVFD